MLDTQRLLTRKEQQELQAGARAMLAALRLVDTALYARNGNLQSHQDKQSLSLQNYEINELRAAIAAAEAAGIKSEE